MKRIIKPLLIGVVALAGAGLATISAATAWGPESRITNAVGHSWSPRLAAFNGVVHAVWFDYVNAGADAEVLYARSTDNGNSWGAPVNLSNNPGRLDIEPSIAADASGVYVGWSTDVMTGDLYFRHSHDGGVSWVAEQVLASGTGYSRASSFAIDQAGRLHIVYYDDRVGYSNIYHRQSCDHGYTWTADQNVTVNDGVVDNEMPHLAVGQDGLLYLAFRSSRGGSQGGGFPPYGMFLVRGTPAACPANPVWIYPARRVSRGLPDEYSDAQTPAIAAGSGGALHLAYGDQLSGNDVAYRRLDPAGAGLGPVRRLAGLGANHPQSGTANIEAGNFGIVEDSAGTLHLMLSENAGYWDAVSYGRLYYRASPDAGRTWGAVEQVGTTTMAAMPNLVYSQGRVHAAWTDFRDNNFGGEIYYRYLTTSVAPAITSANATTFTVGSSGTFTVAATGVPPPALSEAGALPSGVNFVAGSGVLSGIPATATGGTYAITFGANNGIAPNASQGFTLTVNEAPAVTSANHATFTAGSAGTFTITASGYPSPGITVNGSLPNGVTFNPATRLLTGTPASGTGGTYALSVIASNAAGSAPQSFTLTVNEAPAITSANAAAFTVGISGAFTVTASGYPAPTISLASGTTPNGIAFNAPALSGTPGPATQGTTSLSFTATNGIGAPANQLFTLYVNPNCPYSVSPAAADGVIKGGVGALIVTVTTPAGCPVSATSLQPWVIVGTITPNGGTTTVSLQIGANGGAARTTSIRLADRLFFISQQAGP